MELAGTKLTASWNAMPNVDYYRLSYRQLGGVWQFATNPINIDPSITSVDLIGLQDYSSYEWRVKSWCLTLHKAWNILLAFNSDTTTDKLTSTFRGRSITLA